MLDQVTEFSGGGVAVGVALHHAAADGRGLWRFIEMWAAAAAGSAAGELGPPPLHDRRLVHFEGDKDLAGIFLRHTAPELPRVRFSLLQNGDSLPQVLPIPDRFALVTNKSHCFIMLSEKFSTKWIEYVPAAEIFFSLDKVKSLGAVRYLRFKVPIQCPFVPHEFIIQSS